jgi:hypothetical protein
MRSRYPGKGYKLNDLRSHVVRFFEMKNLVVSTEEKDSQTVVHAKTPLGTKILDVCLELDNDGSLLVTFYSPEGSLLIRSSPFPSMIGGGFLTLSRLKMTEIVERLEREFWETVDRFMSFS